MPLLEFWGGGAGSAGLVLALLGVCLLRSLLWEKSKKKPSLCPSPIGWGNQRVILLGRTLQEESFKISKSA